MAHGTICQGVGELGENKIRDGCKGVSPAGPTWRLLQPAASSPSKRFLPSRLI